MKTINTTLPIYKALMNQSHARSRVNGSPIELKDSTIFCPRHRLPSFQWMDDGDGEATVSTIELVSDTTMGIPITTYFVTIPARYLSDAGDYYFIYNGDTLIYALPTGTYYLKITMTLGHVYYSDWFTIQCVYCNFADTFTLGANFTVSDMAITVGAGAIVANSTPVQSVYKGQTISVIFFLTVGVGVVMPTFTIWDNSLGIAISDPATANGGVNEFSLIATAASDDCYIKIQTGTNFTTSEILIYTQYACGYVTLSFTNCCNLGDLLYEDDFVQTLWIKSDNIEQAYPYVEKGQENGEGKFIPTFRRQEKTYIIRTLFLPQYMVEVLQRLKMHDVMTYIDQCGDAYNVESVDVEPEWLFDDKYFATAAITLDLGESITAFGCC